MAASSIDGHNCWTTLVTSASYLPGVIVLAHSLAKQKSLFPLLVLYCRSIGEQQISILKQAENGKLNIRLHQVEALVPRASQENVGSVADRFQDTFSKLRVFEIWKLGFTKTVFLDADMAVYSNPDELFKIPLPDTDWLGAGYACVCNPDANAWAPIDWRRKNCMFTLMERFPGQSLQRDRPTHHLLNSGVLLLHPSETLWKSAMSFFNNSDKLRDYQFPDQDFLKDFFQNKWQALPWKYNAHKTFKYLHPRLWSDDDIAILHYIIDKPWERRIGANGLAGELGRDGPTHARWWQLFDEWRKDTGSTYLDGLVNTKPMITEVVPVPPTARVNDLET